MNEHNKQGLRWWIFNRFGPPEVQNLIEHIDNLTQDGSEIAIYPSGDFSFTVKTSKSQQTDPLIFPTAQERASFQAGLNYGVHLMGGTTTMLTTDDLEILDQMSKKSTHGGEGNYNN
jgi:hypothetical protein